MSLPFLAQKVDEFPFLRKKWTSLPFLAQKVDEFPLLAQKVSARLRVLAQKVVSP